MFAEVMPVESGETFDRPASQPKRVQSCVPARRCTGSVVAATLSPLSRVDAAPHAQSARKDRMRNVIIAAKEGSGEYDTGARPGVEMAARSGLLLQMIREPETDGKEGQRRIHRARRWVDRRAAD